MSFWCPIKAYFDVYFAQKAIPELLEDMEAMGGKEIKQKRMRIEGRRYRARLRNTLVRREYVRFSYSTSTLRMNICNPYM